MHRYKQLKPAEVNGFQKKAMYKVTGRNFLHRIEINITTEQLIKQQMNDADNGESKGYRQNHIPSIGGTAV